MKNKFLLFLIVGFVTISFLEAQTRKEVKVKTVNNSTFINGFKVTTSTYDLVNIDGRTNVVKINGAAVQWNAMEYSLANYKNKPITIYFSADVMRTGPKKGMSWTVNNDPEYPSIAAVNNPQPGVWYNMSGNLTIIPSSDNPFIHLNKWEQNSSNTFFYVDNISIKIETWDYTPASTVAAAGQANSNGTRNIYVSANKGADNGNGTQNQPLKKIADAMHYAKPGDTVLVDSGVYNEKFKMPGGTAGKPVTLTAMPGADVVISPTIPIKPQWKRHQENIYVADISEYVKYIDTNFPQLFADRDSMVEARYPNMTTTMSTMWDYKRDVAQKGTNKNTVVASGNIPTDITGARLIIWPGDSEVPGWRPIISPVGTVKGKTITLANEITGNSSPHTKNDPDTPYPGNPFYITGALALLDAPGEYYFDKQTNHLYFYPSWNGTPEQRTLSMRGNDIAIFAANTSFVTIKNITVFGGGINMRGSTNNTLENCRVFYAQHFYASDFSQIEEYKWCGSMVVTGANNRITRCEFGNTSGNGIVLGGDDSVFTNNYVHDTNYAGNFFDGVYVLSSKQLEISHNTLSNQGRAHIYFAHGHSFEQCIVRNNYCENHSINVPDGAGGFYTINTNGGGSEIFNNFVVVGGGKGDNGSMKRLLSGLYVDDLSFNYKVHHNIVIGGTDAGIRHGFTHAVIPPQQGTYFFNNTIIGSQNGFGFHYIYGQNTDTRSVTITDNLLVNIKSRDITGDGFENGKWVNYDGNFINGTIPVTKNTERRMTSSGNARGTIDAKYRPIGGTTNIGAIPRDGALFAFGADWGQGGAIAAAARENALP
jgi:hypothetical protein